MADQDGRRYPIGFGKPPLETRFRPGRSGNPRGRPKGAKNFATALEEELRARVPVTENGRRRKLSKRQVIAKRLVNRAAEGDLKAVPLLLNEMRPHESAREPAAVEEIFGGPEQQPLIDSIVQRIRAASTTASDQQPEAPPAGREAAGQEPEEAG